MTTVKINEDNIVTVLTFGSLALLALLAAAGVLLGSVRFGLSVIGGGVLALANFYWLKTVLVRSLLLQADTAPRFALIRYIVRLTALAGAVYLLLVYCRADVFGLLLGLSVLVLNIIALSFYMISTKGD
jgi:hypothetical protein